MTNKLEQLKAMTDVVADTGDIEAMRRFKPMDATTNPSLLLKAAALPHYAELLDQAQSTLDSLYSTLREVEDIELDMDVPLADEAFYQALNDDLNTPVAIAEIHALAKQLNKASDADKPRLKARIIAAGNLLVFLVRIQRSGCRERHLTMRFLPRRLRRRSRRGLMQKPIRISPWRTRFAMTCWHRVWCWRIPGREPSGSGGRTA